MTRILFKFIIYPSSERALKNGRVKSKIVRKSSLDLKFCQGSCPISDFARPNLNKVVLVKVFLKFEIVIFNNNFVICMMSSVCSMAEVADWILTRETIKRTNVFYPVCLKNYWRNIYNEVYFVKVARLHTTVYLNEWHLARNLRKMLTEVWKDKKNKGKYEGILVSN